MAYHQSRILDALSKIDDSMLGSVGLQRVGKDKPKPKAKAKVQAVDTDTEEVETRMIDKVKKAVGIGKEEATS